MSAIAYCDRSKLAAANALQAIKVRRNIIGRIADGDTNDLAISRCQASRITCRNSGHVIGE